MKTVVPITKAKAQLNKMVRSGETFTLLKHGEPVAVLVPQARMEAILETLEIVANPAALKAIRNYEAGKGKPVSLRKLEKKWGE